MSRAKYRKVFSIKVASQFIGVLLLSAYFFSCAALAQSSIEGAQETLEVIVVTAQKRESTLQDEAIAVSAIAADEINLAGGFDPSVLSQLVPNFHVGQESNRDGLTLTIRGVSGTDVRNGADPTTAFHVDGSYVPRLSGANAYFYDLERIEVLRGPQGTLYGRNSTSGVVNVVSRKPDLDKASADLETTVGNYNLLQLKGAVNLPFSDKLGVRAALIKNDRDGYRENVFVEDGDDADELGLRSHILYEANDNLSLLLTGEYYARKGVGSVGNFISPPNDTSGLQTNDPAAINPLDTQGFRDNSDVNFRAELNYSFPGIDLTYLAAFRDHERDFLTDSDTTAFTRISSFVRETTNSETWSHEVRFTSTDDSPFQYIVGGYYLREEIDGEFIFQAKRFGGGPFAAFPDGAQFQVRFVDNGLFNESIAGFAHTTYDISDKFRLTAGIRYTEDEKDKGGNAADIGRSEATATGSFQQVFIIGGRQFVPFAPQISNPKFSRLTWKAGLDYRPDSDNLLYLAVGTGFKAGGFNRGSQGTTTNGELLVFRPETVTAYEAGWKSAWLEGRARVNIATFYYDYNNLQQAQVFTAPNGATTNQTINAVNARVWGIELEAEALIGESGRGSVSAGYLNTGFGDFTGVDDNTLGGLQSLDASGNSLMFSPKFNATLSYVPAAFAPSFGGILEPRVQFHYSSKVFLGVLNRPFETQDGYTKTDLSLLYKSESESWYAEVFVRNLENNAVANYQECTDFGPFGTPVVQCENNFNPPRTWGIRLGRNF